MSERIEKDNGDIEEKMKTFLFCLCIIDLDTIIRFFE